MLPLSLLASALFAVSATAQLLASTLPTCASQCSLLIGAQASCATTPASEVSCFCQNAQLAVIKTNPTTNQCTVCSAADWATIAAWYNNACANNGAGFSTLASVTSASVTAAAASSSALSGTGGAAGTDAASATGATSAGQTQAAGGASSASYTGSNAANYSNGQQWWAGHYQWVIMIIVLLFAFLILGIGGRILFRRHQRRKNLGSSSGPAGNWAPNSSAHDFDTQGRQALATAGPVTDEKTEGSRKTKTLTRKLTGR